MDFLELYRRYGCTLQQGGSDQWGNLTAGIDLIHRLEPGAARARAGDAADGEGRRHQVRQVRERRRLARPGDDDAVRVLPVLAERGRPGHLDVHAHPQSFKSREELEELEKLTEERPQARAAQRALAEELTTLVHGGEQCAAVIAASKALFGQGELGELDEATLSARPCPRCRTPGSPSSARWWTCWSRSGSSASKSAARRTVKEGGAYVNNAKVADGETRSGRGGAAARALAGAAPGQEEPGGRRGRRPADRRQAQHRGRSRVTRGRPRCCVAPAGQVLCLLPGCP